MENNLENLTIGVFAKAAGVNVETIRFYQRKGLLLEPDKPYGSIRRYGEADVTRVRFVKSAQRLGFSLDEIAEPTRDAIMDVVRISLSARGYEKTLEVMRLNRVLGDLVGGPAAMNEWSYLFCLFDTFFWYRFNEYFRINN